MKKLLIVLLALATVFAFAACGNTTEEPAADAPSAIDLGGGLGEYPLEGDAFGNYEVIDTPDEFLCGSSKDEVTVYEDLDCDTPYIAVYRFAKGEYTLETLAQSEADLYSKGYYQTFEATDDRPDGAYLCTNVEYDGNFYYVDTQIFEDGDDFVEIDCYSKTQELQIGDTDVYAWVPVGYTDLMNQDSKDHGTIFWGEYSDDYYLPKIWLGKWDSSYEYLNWYWGEEYPDGVPYTEEEYANALAEGESGDYSKYFEKMGATLDFSSYDSEQHKYDYNGGYYVLSGICDGVEAWFQVGDDWYCGWFSSELDPKPAYAGTFLNSLHTK